MMSACPHGGEILNHVRQQQALMKDAWLTAIGHKRPMQPGWSLAEAQSRSAEIETQIRKLLPPAQ
jgi:hypothetical protein